MTGIAAARPRLVFLDNMRYFIIFFVILQHVALIYVGQAGREIPLPGARRASPSWRRSPG
jgi:hypothetical protein